MSDGEKKPDSHIGDALAHAMIPPTETPAEPAPASVPAPGAVQSAIAQDEAIENVPVSDDDPRAVYSGEITNTLERMWPMAWLAMLTVVSVIGIYNAVRMLP